MVEKAYLDIETSYSGEITILGIFRPPDDLVQMVHPDVSPGSLLGALDGTEEIVSYWGHRFDLPVIARCLGINLRDFFHSRDLADDCHRCGLFGGLKSVERALGIIRQTDGLSGIDAMRLWQEWRNGSERALKILLKYNEEDVVNLYLIEKEISQMEVEK